MKKIYVIKKYFSVSAENNSEIVKLTYKYFKGVGFKINSNTIKNKNCSN